MVVSNCWIIPRASANPIIADLIGPITTKVVPRVAPTIFGGPIGLTVAAIGFAVAAYEFYQNGHKVAQVNIDNLSRPLTPAEIAAGVTNKAAGNGQDVNLPTNGGKLFGPGSVANPSGSNGFTQCSSLGLTTSWQGSSNGANAWAYGDSRPSVPFGYSTPRSIGACQNNGIGTTIWQMDTPCQNGYTYSTISMQCVKSDNSIAPLPPDNVCQILRTGNSYAVDPRDPDCVDNGGAVLPTFTSSGGNSNNNVSFIGGGNNNGGGTGSGAATASVAKITSTGTQTDVKIYNPNAASTAANPIYDVTYGRNSAIYSATAGAGQANTTTLDSVATSTTKGAGDVADALAATATPSTSGNSGPVSVNVELPPDLAKKGDIEALGNKLTEVPTGKLEPGFDPKSNFEAATSKIDDLKAAIGTGEALPSIFSFSPALPIGQAQAPPIVWQWGSNTITIPLDSWFDYLRHFLGVLCYVFTPYAIFNIITARKETK